MSVTFKLDEFEGPLDLLLFLLEKNKMSIYDIEIASITDQYMTYIESCVDLELEAMSEFIVMATTLLYIKSKMLLPRHEKDLGIEEDPREELIRKLVEYKKMKYVSTELEERQTLAMGYCFRNDEIGNDIKMPKPTTTDVLEGVSLEILYDTFRNLMKQKEIIIKQKEKKIDTNILQKDSYTIEEKSHYLLNLLQLHEQISFFDLCLIEMPKVEIIVTFMAILELVHKKQICIYQAAPMEDIVITEVKNND
ncbi:MAG: segregation and condensation protein A [Cellulosilyticaceae bacterium]